MSMIESSKKDAQIIIFYDFSAFVEGIIKLLMFIR